MRSEEEYIEEEEKDDVSITWIKSIIQNFK
jgi:hypothetical protein